MAKKKEIIEEETIVENIVTQPLEEIMGDRYATYAKYVIQDRAIPDVRDGLKPVQRRIIFSMFKNNNVYNKPTKKCAHTVGEVMGKLHPHGDTSIYDALARLSQDWKLRYPLVNFQGNNGSIDGDSPAAYRYTESRLSKLSNELIKEIDKNTVDMQFNFDDTELEPVVLPARFPNLLVNGSEGIAVAMATEIPPHNLNEVIDAVIYRISHKTTTCEDLMNIIKGPDFPTGGIIYKSEGLRNIYLNGYGKIENAAKAEIIQKKDIQQIVITEIPYKVVKLALVHEIDKIRYSKVIDGIIEVRDESDWKGISIVIDVKKEAKADLILQYLYNKTPLSSSYSANMVAIVKGHPKTLNILQFIDAYIDHQIEVFTRKTKYDLEKYTDKIHIVNGLIIASININEVVDIIKKSKDKNDSKVNLIKRFELTEKQAEAIVMMPLYKLSHTDELILENEKKELETNIVYCQEILSDEGKLHRAICSDLRAIKKEYGDERRTQIIEKEDIKPINNRDLIAKEEVMISLTRDGYLKRSSVKSYKSNDMSLPGIKQGDSLVGIAHALTTDYLFAFTNLGNYFCIPVNDLIENRWKEEGQHINAHSTMLSGEKIIKGLIIRDVRKDLYLAVATDYGYIKRIPLSSLEFTTRSRGTKYMKVASGGEVVGVELLSGNSDIMVLTKFGNVSYFNENELTVLSPSASGVKAIKGLNKDLISRIAVFEENEHSKLLLITDGGCYRIFDNTKVIKTNRLGKVQMAFRSFKKDQHNLLYVDKIDTKLENIKKTLLLSDNSTFELVVKDYHLTDIMKNAKKNINIPASETITDVFNDEIQIIDNSIVSHPIVVKKTNTTENIENSENNGNKEEKEGFEQISIFDDLD
ncbi:MAG: DNA topoisomerase (ATP-hydrolyzing) subunit A [Bacilli bacterium]